MDFLVNVFIFLAIIFLYIHIVAEYKKSEDLEIYEMDLESTEQLHEVCNVKQPVLFEYTKNVPAIFNMLTIDAIMNGDGAKHEIAIKNTNDYWKPKNTAKSTDDDYSIDSVLFPFQSSLKLLETDTKSTYLSEGNGVFLHDCGLEKTLREVDADFKPAFTISSAYDILFASKNTVTPMRYHTNSRQYIGVTHGKLQIKMAPWKYTRYLHSETDYENYEFRSKINVWNCQEKYRLDLDKVKTIEFDITKGYVLVVPPYWWYSIKFPDTYDNSAFLVSYSTIVNSLANCTDIGRHYMQQQNITHKLTKTMKLDVPEVQKIDVLPQLQPPSQSECTIVTIEPASEETPQIVDENATVDVFVPKPAIMIP